jgi:hypothetical protein
VRSSESGPAVSATHSNASSLLDPKAAPAAADTGSWNKLLVLLLLLLLLALLPCLLAVLLLCWSPDALGALVRAPPTLPLAASRSPPVSRFMSRSISRSQMSMASLQMLPAPPAEQEDLLL